MAFHFKLRVQAPLDKAAARLLLQQHGLRHFRQGRQQGSIDQGERMLNVFQARIVVQWFQLCGQFANDFRQSLGIEDTRGLGQRAERGALTAKDFLYFFELAGLLDGSQRAHDRIKQEQQYLHAILIVVQGPVPRLVARTTIFVEPRKKLCHGLNMLETLQLSLLNLGPFFTRHPCDSAKMTVIRLNYFGGANFVPMLAIICFEPVLRDAAKAQIACRTGLRTEGVPYRGVLLGTLTVTR